MRGLRLLLTAVLSLLLLSTEYAHAQPKKKAEFRLASAVAVEAEDFNIEGGWKVVKNGEGNYMVDMVGFNHISGERLLSATSDSADASAFVDVNVPVGGDYRLWVRYEYPPFSEARFRVQVVQGVSTSIDKIMGAKTNPRYAFGDRIPKPQYDPSWGPEGLVEEVVTVPGLKKGPARIYLKTFKQPQTPGVAANRNIDFVYLTRDTQDAWLAEYAKQANLYPILGVFRDSYGPRYEVRFTNLGPKPANFTVNHTYNRLPWGMNEGAVAVDIKPGASSDWFGLKLQDTCHFSLVTFASSIGEPFDLQIRAKGGEVEREAAGQKQYAFYLPPYPGKGEKPATQVEKIDAILKYLAERKPIGKTPTRPLCYGGWMPIGRADEVGHKYAELYAAIGMRSLHSANGPIAIQLKNLDAVGVPPTRSWSVGAYRNPPTTQNIEAAKKELERDKMAPWLLWFDYGDEIGFSEWIGMMVAPEAAATKKPPQEIIARLWRDWLNAKHPRFKPADYWLAKWGALDATKLRPDSSAAAADANPRLYVDSVLFYEETAINHVAAGRLEVKKALGQNVLCGANYSAHPFYYPTTSMYVKWFRGGAADFGRHSDYFWQVGQLGPMINGYVAEHFRCGMRNNPNAVLRQYNMPHSPGNSEASFLRSAFTHLAHGAKMLDFFGIGLNESFTENHIDHRDHARYRAIRDVTHSIGLVEDLLPDSSVLPSDVALLVSESTERWDFAGIATDHAGHAYFGPDFRKTRLSFHLERLGIWKALTFLGSTPDLLIEDDLIPAVLRGYKVLVVVGDCFPPEKVKALEDWVKAGGVLLATAEAGTYDPYHQPSEALSRLLGLNRRVTERRVTFMRPRQELPFQSPLATIAGDNWTMPQIAISERIEVGKDLEILARFKDNNSPALTARALGKGRAFYAACWPGVSYLWSGVQPPIVPDRSPTSHMVPTAWDPGARELLKIVLLAGSVKPAIIADPPLVDCRLLKAARGHILPIANYGDKVGRPVTLSVRFPGAISKVTSAYHGELPAVAEGGRLKVTIPALGYGDVLRIDP